MIETQGRVDRIKEYCGCFCTRCNEPREAAGLCADCGREVREIELAHCPVCERVMEKDELREHLYEGCECGCSR